MHVAAWGGKYPNNLRDTGEQLQLNIKTVVVVYGTEFTDPNKIYYIVFILLYTIYEFFVQYLYYYFIYEYFV